MMSATLKIKRQFPPVFLLAVVAFFLTAIAVPVLIPSGRSAWSSGHRRVAARRGHPRPTKSGAPIYLSEAQPLVVHHVGVREAVEALTDGSAQPSALVTSDLDADGLQDLVVGYSHAEDGILAVHRGNLDAFAPQSRESFDAIGRGDFPSPFLTNATAIAVPVHPDFIAEGRFNPYGFRDVIIAERGGSTIYLLSNDGRGNLSQPKAIDIDGSITALAVGEFGKTGSFTKLLLGICDQKGAGLRLYEGAYRSLGQMNMIPLAGRVSQILAGNGEPSQAAVVVSDGQALILDLSSMKLAAPALPARAVALGSFVYDRNGAEQLELLQSDGSIDIAAQNDFDPHVLTVAEMKTRRQAALAKRSGARGSTRSTQGPGWKIIEHISTAITLPEHPVFLRTRISDRGADDLMAF